MDHRLQQVLESLLLNLSVLNEEVARMARSDQFSASSRCFYLIEDIRDQCTGSLQNISTVERQLYKRRQPPPEAEILPFEK